MTFPFGRSGSKLSRCMSILLALAFLAGTIIARAQVQTSTEISGVVSDPRGAVVAGADVTLTTRTPVPCRLQRPTAPAPTPSSRSSPAPTP